MDTSLTSDISPMHAAQQPMDAHTSVVLVVIALGVWALEHRRRAGDADGASSALGGFAGMLWRLLPELMALGAVAAYAGVRLSQGGHNNHAAPILAEDTSLWEGINNEWPILTTADSLLALQAMLRCVLLASAARWGKEADSSPLSGESVLFLALAAVLRLGLLMASPSDVYHLDGPLGGVGHLIFEVASVVMLAYLSFRTLKHGLFEKACLPACAVAVLCAALLSARNRLALATPEANCLDILFSLSELIECLAAVAFLARTIRCAEGTTLGSFSSFAHLLLPVQQLMPVYFMLTAWGSAPLEEVEALVGAGRPFELLQLAGVAQVGLYLLAGGLHLSLGTPAKQLEFLAPRLLEVEV
mmetsp:Transcript_5264/g.19811  ORF Transcript_5264/g.19811 Transcript_5264/m.19811 type:complete len:359 (-) Transcript_5264:656-1732(-)